MKRPGPITVLLLLLLLPMAATLVGCGGTSQDDIRKMMAKRSLDRGEPAEEEEEKPAAATPVATPTSPAIAPATPAATGGEYVTAEQAPAATPSPSGEASEAQTPAARVVSSDPVERATIAARNLDRIATALKAYVDKKEYYPDSATMDRLKTPLLSWRVQLLPFLGELQLYHQFNHDEPWNSPHNRRLLDKMPEVYRSPERTDNKTCVMALMSKESLFGQPRPVNYTKVEDGESNTLAMVEVNADQAIEWTKPGDFEVNHQAPLAGLGGQRGGRVYVAWADGTTGSIAADTPPDRVRAAISYEGGESFKGYQISEPIDPAAGNAVAVVATEPGSAPGAVGPGASTPSPGGAAVVSSAGSQLASKYWDAAAAAKQQGLTDDAWKWLGGAVCAGAPASQWASEFEWAPALRRPVFGLHLGVGVFGDYQRDAGPRRRDDDRSRLADTMLDKRDRVLDATAPVGEPLIELLEVHAAQAAPSAISSGEYDPLNKRRLRPEDFPPVTYLEPTRGVAELVRDAAAKGCDVVAAIEVETRTNGDRFVTITLYDVFRKTRLETTGRVLSPADERDTTFLRDREYQESRWRLKDFLEDKLAPGPWPVTMTAELAAARLETLGASRNPWPLTALMEMRYYRAKGLVDDAQLLRAMTDLLGDDALPLLLGTETKQRRVLREWLPGDDPAAVVAVADQRRRQRDDEDD